MEWIKLENTNQIGNEIKKKRCGWDGAKVKKI